MLSVARLLSIIGRLLALVQAARCCAQARRLLAVAACQQAEQLLLLQVVLLWEACWRAGVLEVSVPSLLGHRYLLDARSCRPSEPGGQTLRPRLGESCMHGPRATAVRGTRADLDGACGGLLSGLGRWLGIALWRGGLGNLQQQAR